MTAIGKTELIVFNNASVFNNSCFYMQQLHIWTSTYSLLKFKLTFQVRYGDQVTARNVVLPEIRLSPSLLFIIIISIEYRVLENF